MEFYCPADRQRLSDFGMPVLLMYIARSFPGKKEDIMDIFGFLKLLGGLALFLYGMHIMGDGLSKTSGGKMEQILEKFTSKPIKAVILGAAVTAVIQSSSATTVMVVGFVNSGVMKLGQAVGIIMGANIGTTVTSWILSLTQIEGDTIWLKLLNPSSFSPVLAVIGAFLVLFAKKESRRDVGTILIGFAILMFGMENMSDAVAPLADVPEFTGILTMFKNPVLGMLAGAVLTAIIQSSSASVGILQALCSTGAVGFDTAIPIIMGQNIGTCVTAMISGIGANKNAKRAALVHLYFNVVGTLLFMTIFYTLNAVIDFRFMGAAANESGIAIVHSLFNVTATLLLLPFRNILEKLACLTIRDDKEHKEEFTLLDVRFLDKPAFAIAQAKKAGKQMAEVSKKGLIDAIGLFKEYNEEIAQEIISIENQVDHYEDEIGTYLMRLGNRELAYTDSQTVSILLHCIGDFERISDHAVNIMETAKEMHDKKESFSRQALEELKVYGTAVHGIMELAIRVFENEDKYLAYEVEPLEEVIDRLNEKVRKRHIDRLREGACTIELGFPLLDLITNFERVADHCSNLAVCIIQVKDDGFETHEYLDNLQKDSPYFKEKYEEYREKYRLPDKKIFMQQNTLGEK